MNIFPRILISVLLLLIFLPASPQRIELLPQRGDTTGMREALLWNTPAENRSPGMPMCAVASSNGKFAACVGGALKATMGYDFGNITQNPNEFIPANISTHGNAGDDAAFRMSAQQTTFYLNVVALPLSENAIGAYIKLNLIGNNYTPKIHYALLHYRGLTAGYSYTLFSDMQNMPPNIDYEGPNSMVAIPGMGIRYEWSFGRHRNFSAGVALENPHSSMTCGNDTRQLSSRTPKVPAYIRYSFLNSQGWVRLAAQLRTLSYRNLLADKDVTSAGWGLSLSVSSPVAGGLTLYGKAATGRGLADNFIDINGDGCDMLPAAAHPGTLKMPFAWGGYGGLRYDFSPNLYASATYSHLRLYSASSDFAYAPDRYSWSQYISSNVFWTIRPQLVCAIEYLYGRRKDLSGAQGHASRLQTLIQFNF